MKETRLCGVPVTFSGETAQSDRIWQFLNSLLAFSDTVPLDQTVDPLAINLVERGDVGLPSLDLSPVYDSPDLKVSRYSDGYVLQCGNSVLVAGDSSAIASIDDDFWNRGLQARRELFLTGVLMLLHRRGRFGMHANGLKKGNTGILITGDSGAGKTTLTLALLRAGWSYLSDDAVVLHEINEGVEAMAFRRGFSCTAQTREQFRELQPAGDEWENIAPDKWLGTVRIDGRELFASQCLPTVIVHPQQSGESKSRIELMSPIVSLGHIIRQSAGIIAESELATEQLNLVRDLVEQSVNVRLLTGTDVFTSPDAVSELIESCFNDPVSH